MQSTSELELVGERFDHYIILRESILTDSRFTLGEKFFIARISGFKTYHETNEHCADFLNISIATIKRAKAKLIELGVLEEISFDGKKKIFAVKLERLEQETFEPAQEDVGSTKATSWLNGSHQLAHDEPHIIKNNIKVKEKTLNIDSKESILAQEPNGDVEEVDDSAKCEKQTEFGNHDINEAFVQWQDATGYDFRSNQYERRAMFNLLRRKDIQAFGGFKPLVLLVKEANHISNQFAPKIIKPSELGGKYSKFEKLVEWSKRKDNDSQASTVSNQKKFEHKCTEQELAYISSYYRPHPYCKETAEEPTMTAEEEARWKEERHQESLRARAIFERRLQEKADAKKELKK